MSTARIRKSELENEEQKQNVAATKQDSNEQTTKSRKNKSTKPKKTIVTEDESNVMQQADDQSRPAQAKTPKAATAEVGMNKEPNQSDNNNTQETHIKTKLTLKNSMLEENDFKDTPAALTTSDTTEGHLTIISQLKSADCVSFKKERGRAIAQLEINISRTENINVKLGKCKTFENLDRFAIALSKIVPNENNQQRKDAVETILQNIKDVYKNYSYEIIDEEGALADLLRDENEVRKMVEADHAKHSWKALAGYPSTLAAQMLAARRLVEKETPQAQVEASTSSSSDYKATASSSKPSAETEGTSDNTLAKTTPPMVTSKSTTSPAPAETKSVEQSDADKHASSENSAQNSTTESAQPSNSGGSSYWPFSFLWSSKSAAPVMTAKTPEANVQATTVKPN